MHDGEAFGEDGALVAGGQGRDALREFLLFEPQLVDLGARGRGGSGFEGGELGLDFERRQERGEELQLAGGTLTANRRRFGIGAFRTELGFSIPRCMEHAGRIDLRREQ